MTLPLLRPSLQTAIILRVILAFEVFAVVVALAGTNLPVLMGETYHWQFALQDRNVAAAYAHADPRHLDRASRCSSSTRCACPKEARI